MHAPSGACAWKASVVHADSRCVDERIVPPRGACSPGASRRRTPCTIRGRRMLEPRTLRAAFGQIRGVPGTSTALGGTSILRDACHRLTRLILWDSTEESPLEVHELPGAELPAGRWHRALARRPHEVGSAFRRATTLHLEAFASHRSSHRQHIDVRPGRTMRRTPATLRGRWRRFWDPWTRTCRVLCGKLPDSLDRPRPGFVW